MTALLVGFAVVAVADWVAVDRGVTRLEHVAKPGALALLVAAATVMDPADDSARVALVAALALSLVGDVALMLPGRFAAGLGAFLAGHLAYVAAFAIDGVEAGWLLAGLLGAAAIATFVGRPVVRAVAASEEPGLTRPVAAYVAVICAMVVFAVGTGDPLAIVGAALFATSDSLIARQRFVATMTRGRLAIITTYHLAQVLLVLSFMA